MAILEPRQTWQIVPASQTANLLPQRVLIVGQKTASGTATDGELVRDIANDNSWNTKFGRTSQLAGMIRQFREINEITELDALCLDDAGGASVATGVVTLSGTASAAGSLIFNVGSKQNHSYQVDVVAGDSASDIGDDLVTAITADLDAPFDPVNSTGTVTISASNAGLVGNEWSLSVEGEVTGITVSLTGWTGGATDPTLTSILDVISNIRYQTVVWPSTYSLSVIETELNSRFNVAYKIMDGIAIQTKKGTAAALKTYANQNSQSVCVIGNKTLDQSNRKGTAIQEMPDIISAEFAAFRCLKSEDDAPLADYLSTVAALDQFGGRALGALPYFNTLMPNLPVPNAQDEFTDTELADLTDNAVSVISANRAYNGTILGWIVSTYLTNAAGNADNSYKYLEVVDTASKIREFYYENFRSRYAQTRLTDGDLIAGRDMANESSIRSFCNRLYDLLADDALVQSGSLAKKDFNDNLVISIDISTGKVTINMAPLLVTQLRVVLGTIQINFGS